MRRRNAQTWFLSPREKAEELSGWLAARAAASDPSYPGTPDPDIYGLVDALNALPGVCTVQSCSGHGPEERKADGGITPGRVWLRLSARVFRRFERHVAHLIAGPGVEEASVRYGRARDGAPPVVDIVFAGKERGHLAESGAAILDFFERIAGGALLPRRS
jgi:hypothetical protein